MDIIEREPMTVLVCGVSHNSASVAVRERLAFSQDDIPLIIEHLVSMPQVSQAVLLTTCNRTEIYCDAQDSSWVVESMAEFANLEVEQVHKASYCYSDLQAVEHIMRVACGLESMVVGESEILGQMKEAVRLANSVQGLDQRFHALFQRVFALAKQVRSSTEIGVCPVSVASIAVQFVQQNHASLEQAHVVLLGSGQTMSLALKYLAKRHLGKLTVLSRTLANAQLLAEPFDAYYGSFDDISQAIDEADVVLSATASDWPIVTSSTLADVAQNKPRVMVDMAMPRDIDPEIKTTSPCTTLYTIDDLSQVAHQHVESRRHAAQQAAVMIRQQAQEYMNWLKSLSDLNLVKILRRHVDQTRQQELDKAKQMLQQGEDPEAVLERLAYSLANKLMHEPTVQMREASLKGRQDVLETLQDIFALCPTQ